MTRQGAQSRHMAPSRKRWTVASGTLAVTILALAWAVFIWFVPSGTPHGGPDIATDTGNVGAQAAEPAGPAVTENATVPATAASTETSQSVARDVGTCLGSDGELVDCLLPHRQQVVGDGPNCELAVLRSFLGVMHEDVLRPDLTFEQLDDGVCAVSVADGDKLQGDLRGAFSFPATQIADQLRHCLNRDFHPTGCVGGHHGEVVGQATTGANCAQTATMYMDVQLTNFPDELSLVARGEDCIVTVKGENQLTTTLHQVGRRSLPIEPVS